MIVNNPHISTVAQAHLKVDAKTKEAAQNFEAFFLAKMMEPMFEGISTNSMFGGGHAEKIYRSMLLDQYGKTMAKAGGIGVADYVMDTMLKIQEQQNLAKSM